MLYSEQKKALAANDSQQNRWHPAFIPFCIAIYNKSSSAYKLIWNSQFLKLSHETTLKKYLSSTTPQVGINPEVVEFIWNDWDIVSHPECKRNVSFGV